MSSSQTQRLVLITGATGGIGRATAIAFAKTGKYKLALHYNRADQATRDRLLDSIRDAAPSSSAPDTVFYQADLSTYDGARGLHGAIVSTQGPVDVLFNNAGATGGVTGVRDLGEVAIEVFEQTWRLNAGTGILLAQLCIPHMAASRWGRVVFNSSMAALTGGFVGPHYASSKSALHGFVHWLGNNVAARGVTVNAVAPAMISDTSFVPDPRQEEVEAEIAKKLPVGRLGRPEEIAATVLYLVDTPFVTRKVITVDGGYHPC